MSNTFRALGFFIFIGLIAQAVYFFPYWKPSFERFVGNTSFSESAFADNVAKPNAVPSQEITKQNVSVLIGITTGFTRRAYRNANRETWLQLSPSPYKNNNTWVHKFILGESTSPELAVTVSEEAQQHGDIEFFPFMDTYNNLTLKTMSLIEYAVRHYNFEYLVKIDDDSYFQLDRLLDEMPRLRKWMLAWGNVGGFHPIRDQKSKWYLPESEWPGNRTNQVMHYLLHGPCYILTNDLALRIYNRTLQPDYAPIHLEDVNLSAILVDLGVGPAHGNQFIYEGCPMNNDTASDDCNLSRHYCDPDLQREHHRMLLDRRKTFGIRHCLHMPP
eukprot:TRINITY_DN14626_c0_g1_i1.p1 TRINITY_DN14626_c0_g1~~TRINITY_DN14626_c0_g1_i1.p1  ORF type:complete len:330 (-),score=71.85 TRINITY_DN14626_c0_g1_i1:199-1188(-)